MHHSKLCTVMIDCEAGVMKQSVEFWSGAFGCGLDHPYNEKDNYFWLAEDVNGTRIGVQKRDGDTGIHLDIETDDVDAEVARLEALGARRKYKIKDWWVMEDPSGNAFCVIVPEHQDFPKGAKRWGG